MTALTVRQLEALHEVDEHQAKGLLYWIRPATMRQLADLGLVETWRPPSVAERPRMRARPYRLTTAGRARLERKE